MQTLVTEKTNYDCSYLQLECRVQPLDGVQVPPWVKELHDAFGLVKIC